MLISASKSSVTLLTPDTHQAKIHPSIFIENSHLPLVKCPRILGVYLDPSLSFNKHSQYVAERVSGMINILKALAGTSWGQGSRQIDHQLCRTCLESKPTRHQLQKIPIFTERGSEDCYWISQDVQYRSPTHRSRDAES